MVMVALPPFDNEPMFQIGEVQLPLDGVAFTNVYPEGKTSVTDTFDAS